MQQEDLRSWRRFFWFLAAWLPASCALAPFAYAGGAALGALVDLHLTMLHGMDFADAYRCRMTHAMVWGSGFGKVAEALPMTCAVLLIMVIFLVAGLWCYGRAPRSWWTSAARFRWGLFGQALAVILFVSAVFLPLSGWLGDHRYVWPLARLSGERWGWWSLAPLALTILIRAAGEELVFRGWFLQQAGALVSRPLLPIAVGALLFAFAHDEWDVLSLAMRFIAGLAFGWAAVRANGLEVSLGAHVAWNMGMKAFSEVRRVPVDRLGRPIGVLPATHWEQAALVVGFAIATLLMVELLARRAAPALAPADA